MSIVCQKLFLVCLECTASIRKLLHIDHFSSFNEYNMNYYDKFCVLEENNENLDEKIFLIFKGRPVTKLLSQENKLSYSIIKLKCSSLKISYILCCHLNVVIQVFQV